MCFWQDSRYFCSFFSCLLAGAEARAALLPLLPPQTLCGQRREAGQRLLTVILRKCFEVLEWTVPNWSKRQSGSHYTSHGRPWENGTAADECDHTCAAPVSPPSPDCGWPGPADDRRAWLALLGRTETRNFAPPSRGLQDVWEGTNQSHRTDSEEFRLEGTEGDLCFPGRRH